MTDLPDHGTPSKRSRRYASNILCVSLVILTGVAIAAIEFSTRRQIVDGEDSSRVRCASNLRQIGQGILLYRRDNAGHYPPTLSAVLATQEISPETFICPKSSDRALGEGWLGMPTAQAIIANGLLSSGHHCSYIYVGSDLPQSADPDTVVAYEPLADHDNDASNVLYADGHVSFEWRPIIQQIDADRLAGVRPVAIRNVATQRVK